MKEEGDEQVQVRLTDMPGLSETNSRHRQRTDRFWLLGTCSVCFVMLLIVHRSTGTAYRYN